MLIVRLLLLASLPILDLAVGFLVSENFRTRHCGDEFCWSLLAIAANAALTWAAIYLGLFLLVIAAARIPSIILRGLLSLLLTLLVATLLIQCSFTWSLGLTSGFLPSTDIVAFLIDNLTRIPQHLLQTAPAMTFGISFTALLFSFALTKLFSGPTRRMRLPLGAVLIFAAWTATAFGAYLSAPSAIAKFSAVAFNKMLLVRFDPSHADYVLDTALKKTFVARAPSAPITKAGSGHPVIVILVESLRRDLIHMDPTPVPFLKSLAEGDGIFFDKAYATASHSNYADVAFWYSRYPMRSLNLQYYPTDAGYRGTSIFKLMKQHGYTTGYISSQNELWGKMINWLNVPAEVDYFYHSEDFAGDTWYHKADRKGIGQLIRMGIATAGKIEDSQTLKIASRWIEGLGNERRFFLGMNLQNTHFSYVIPPGGARPYQPSEIESGALYYLWPVALKTVVRNRYLNAVHNLDRELSSFAAALKARNLWDEALVVIVGDSGEAFHEHGFGNHSGPMYDEVMRTFVMVKPPKTSALPRETFQEAVSHLDITATIPDILGMPIPASFQGRPVFKPGAAGPVFMHSNALVKQNGLVHWPWKLLKTYYPFEKTELYDLARDPGETRNLAESESGNAARLSGQLDLWINRHLLYYSAPEYYRRYNPPK
jgi:arylsulfatase A-like enzyme